MVESPRLLLTADWSVCTCSLRTKSKSLAAPHASSNVTEPLNASSTIFPCWYCTRAFWVWWDWKISSIQLYNSASTTMSFWIVSASKELEFDLSWHGFKWFKSASTLWDEGCVLVGKLIDLTGWCEDGTEEVCSIFFLCYCYKNFLEMLEMTMITHPVFVYIYRENLDLVSWYGFCACQLFVIMCMWRQCGSPYVSDAFVTY